MWWFSQQRLQTMHRRCIDSRLLALAGTRYVQNGDTVCIQPSPESRRIDSHCQRHDPTRLTGLVGQVRG